MAGTIEYDIDLTISEMERLADPADIWMAFNGDPYMDCIAGLAIDFAYDGNRKAYENDIMKAWIKKMEMAHDYGV